MISKPRDFVHVTKMDKTDAARMRDSKVSWAVFTTRFHVIVVYTADAMPPICQGMAEISAALRMTAGDLVQQDHPDAHVRGQANKENTAVPITTEPAHQPTPIEQAKAEGGPLSAPGAVGRRKAPPPITPSIIKAAGLPEGSATFPAGATVVPRTAKRRSTLASVPASNYTQPRTSLDVPVAQDASLPPSSSTIQRGAISDIERLLDAPLDGLPAAACSEAASPEEPTTAHTNGLPGVPMPPPIPDEPSTSRTGTVRSTTLQNLALSPSMEDMVSQAVIVEPAAPDESHMAQPRAAEPAGPLMYMTDSTKAKWDGKMEDIAQQLRDVDPSELAAERKA